MKKSISLIATITGCILMLSFTNVPAGEFTGNYGVCDADPSHLQLQIHEDHTFSYTDYSNPNQKIDATGTWMQRGKKVILTGNNAAQAFRAVWKFEKDGQAITSRRGLSYYRLVKLDAK